MIGAQDWGRRFQSASRQREASAGISGTNLRKASAHTNLYIDTQNVRHTGKGGRKAMTVTGRQAVKVLLDQNAPSKFYLHGIGNSQHPAVPFHDLQKKLFFGLIFIRNVSHFPNSYTAGAHTE